MNYPINGLKNGSGGITTLALESPILREPIGFPKPKASPVAMQGWASSSLTAGDSLVRVADSGSGNSQWSGLAPVGQSNLPPQSKQR